MAFLTKDVFSVRCIKKLDSTEEREVARINDENYIDNGGQLRCYGVLPYDYALLAKCGTKVIGYALVAKTGLLLNSVYVMQVAVDNHYKHMGVGKALYSFLGQHSKGFDYITSNVHVGNTASENFHKKMGFKPIKEPFFNSHNLALKVVHAPYNFNEAPRKEYKFDYHEDLNALIE